MPDNFNISNNKDLLHFEATMPDGEKAFIEYRWHKERLMLMHTVVPENMEGKGVASALAHYALEYAKTNSIQVTVYCIFVQQYLQHHPQYNYLLTS